jgi:hypothetical protein
MSIKVLQYAIGLLVLLNIGCIIWLFEAKRDIKECEANPSPFCPVFTCENSTTKCGYMPWRCEGVDTGSNTCSENSDKRVCMETTKE